MSSTPSDHCGLLLLAGESAKNAPIPLQLNNTAPVLQLPPIPHWAAHTPVQKQSTLAHLGPSHPTAAGSTQQSQGTSIILAAFGCEFDSVLGYIHCKRHELLIPTSILQNHLFQEHCDDFPVDRDRKSIVGGLLTSLKDLYGLDPFQGHPQSGWELLYPVHKRVYAGRCCSQCHTFFHTNHRRQYNKHFEECHKGMEKNNWRNLQFFSALHQPFEQKKLYLIPSQNQSPPLPTATTHPTKSGSPKPSPDIPLDFPPPQFCQDLGFVSWTKSLGQEQAVLNYLTATPGTIATKNLSGKDASLEETLFRVHTFLDHYLSSGQNWLFAHHSRLQDIIGKR